MLVFIMKTIINFHNVRAFKILEELVLLFRYFDVFLVIRSYHLHGSYLFRRFLFAPLHRGGAAFAQELEFGICLLEFIPELKLLLGLDVCIEISIKFHDIFGAAAALDVQVVTTTS
jgi:hypothetical protein